MGAVEGMIYKHQPRQSVGNTDVLSPILALKERVQ